MTKWKRINRKGNFIMNDHQKNLTVKENHFFNYGASVPLIHPAKSVFFPSFPADWSPMDLSCSIFAFNSVGCQFYIFPCSLYPLSVNIFQFIPPTRYLKLLYFTREKKEVIGFRHRLTPSMFKKQMFWTIQNGLSRKWGLKKTVLYCITRL